MAYSNHPFGDASFGGESEARYTGVIQSIQSPAKKRYLYKIYDTDGEFITTWNDVVTEPKFSSEINNGFSELTIRLARSESKYDEGKSVAYGNRLKLYCFDKDSGYAGSLIYSGLLTRYTPIIQGSYEYIDVTFLSHWLELNQLIVEVSGDTTFTYSSDDPTDMLKDLLDKFTTEGGLLDYNSTSTEDTGESETYAFNTQTYQECIKKVIELAPYGYYLRVGADDIIYFREKSATADHILTLGKEISDYMPEKRLENIVNTIYFVGGGTPKLYKKIVSSGSVTAYGTKAIKYIDQRVTLSATATAIANRILDNLSTPEIRVQIKVLDNGGENFQNERGYNIESFLVGDTIQIRNATSKGNNKWDEAIFDTDSWDFDITNASGIILQIVRIDYTPDYVILELSNKQPNISQRIEEVNKSFIESQTADNPSTPAV